MINRYWGSTQSISGSGSLEGKARINITEGYYSGASTYGVTLPSFYVTNFNWQGPDNQQLDLSASSRLDMLRQTGTYVDNSITGAKYGRMQVTADGSLPDDFRTTRGTWDVVGSNVQVTKDENDTLFGYLYYVQPKLYDFSVTAILEGDNFTSGATAGGMGIAFRQQAPTEDDTRGYMFKSTTLAGNVELVKYLPGSGITQLDAASFNFYGGSRYYFMVQAVGDDIRGYISTDGLDYDLMCSAKDTEYPSGYASVVTRAPTGGGTMTYQVWDMQVSELLNSNLQQDVVSNTLALGEIYNVDHIVPYSKSSLPFTTGSSGDLLAVTEDLSASELQNYSTKTYDVTINTGVSGSYFGWGNQLGASRFTSLFLQVAGSTWGHYIRDYNAGAFDNTITGVADNIKIYPNTEYRLTYVEAIEYAAWFVNDRLVVTYTGASRRDNGDYGLQTIQEGSTATNEFSDIEFKHLDRRFEDIFLNAQGRVGSVLNRVVPPGIDLLPTREGVRLSEIGSSSNSIATGTSLAIITAQQSYDNQVNRFVVAGQRQQKDLALVGSTRARQSPDFLSPQFVNVEDERIEAIRDANEAESIELTIETKPVPYLEIYDRMNVIDNDLGISATFRASSFFKRYDFSGGNASYTINLNKITDDN